MGEWFTSRPAATYLVRWTGQDVAELVADVQLPARLAYEVGEDGALTVHDTVLGTVQQVAVGSWFAPTQVWDDAAVREAFQGLPGEGPWAFAMDTAAVEVSGV